MSYKTKKDLTFFHFRKLNPDLNRQVRCLAAAEVDGVGALIVPEVDPGAEPEVAAQAPWNDVKDRPHALEITRGCLSIRFNSRNSKSCVRAL